MFFCKVCVRKYKYEATNHANNYWYLHTLVVDIHEKAHCSASTTLKMFYENKIPQETSSLHSTSVHHKLCHLPYPRFTNMLQNMRVM